jgi:uncharacterized protein DUF5670
LLKLYIELKLTTNSARVFAAATSVGLRDLQSTLWVLMEEKIMLWTILVVLMILWLLGLIGGIGGGLIHLLLVIAVIVLIFQLLSGRRTVV